jgi:uncharacterized protein YdhG (YjbR/CyaY superfamily)
MKSLVTIKTADDYIDNQPEEARPFLEEVRGFIKSQIPKSAEETISYQVVAYKYHGMLVGFGIHKTGCSFFTMNASLLSKMKDDLSKIKYSGTTLHLGRTEKLPKALLRKIIKIRISENEKRAQAKGRIATTQKTKQSKTVKK